MYRNQPLRQGINPQECVFERDCPKQRWRTFVVEQHLRDYLLVLNSHPRVPDIHCSDLTLGELERFACGGFHAERFSTDAGTAVMVAPVSTRALTVTHFSAVVPPISISA